MAASPNAEALQRLETRAIGAEKLIELLKTQISQIRMASNGPSQSGEAAEIATLKAENEKLKRDIEVIVGQPHLNRGKIESNLSVPEF